MANCCFLINWQKMLFSNSVNFNHSSEHFSVLLWMANIMTTFLTGVVTIKTIFHFKNNYLLSIIVGVSLFFQLVFINCMFFQNATNNVYCQRTIISLSPSKWATEKNSLSWIRQKTLDASKQGFLIGPFFTFVPANEID